MNNKLCLPVRCLFRASQTLRGFESVRFVLPKSATRKTVITRRIRLILQLRLYTFKSFKYRFGGLCILAMSWNTALCRKKTRYFPLHTLSEAMQTDVKTTSELSTCFKYRIHVLTIWQQASL